MKGIEETYSYIAVFKHLPDSTSYFHGHILSLKFGQSDLLDDLIEYEQGIEKDDDIFDIISIVNEITCKSTRNEWSYSCSLWHSL